MSSVKKLSKALFVIRSLRNLVDQCVLRNFAYFHSLLMYGLEIWGHAPDYLFQKVFILQKSAIRILANAHYRAECLDLFEQLDILPLPALYILQITVFFKKNPHYLVDSVPSHNHNTRNKNMYTPYKHRTTSYEKGPLYSGQKLYNALPQIVKEQQSVRVFKTMLKKILFLKKVYSIDDMYK